MSLDAINSLVGKPSPMHPVETVVPDEEVVPDADDVIHETMSIRELQRMLAMISEKRKRLKVVGGEVGSDRVVTARSLLTGV